jgi:predicted neuraminidase
MRRRTFLLTTLAAGAPGAAGGVEFTDLLPPGPGNPRNTEGSFVQLRNGSLLFAYTKFTGGGADHDSAHIATRTSRDEGRTWGSEDQVLVSNNAAQNVMSVSFLRPPGGPILLFYLRKNSDADCQVQMRISRDEARTWSPDLTCTTDPGYFVLNNDRAVRLRRGRILLPVSQRSEGGDRIPGRATVYLSDDGGRTWGRGKQTLDLPESHPAGLQEPGVIELKDRRAMMFCRTTLGSQYICFSEDGGDTWSDPSPSSLASPLSPASIKRIPKTGHLLAVWNDHSGPHGDGRTPLTVAISQDEGKTWVKRKNLRDDPAGWYCYTAIAFVRDHVLLAYNAGGAGLPRLSRMELARFPVSFLYA